MLGQRQAASVMGRVDSGHAFGQGYWISCRLLQ
jgi:hypothetical protein